MQKPIAHKWKFARIGGLDQVILSTADDLLNLHQLDQKLWVALSCPVTGLELDETTLKLIDTDHDARIRVPELLAAINWIAPRLQNPADILAPSANYNPSKINTATPEGAAINAAAEQLLKLLPENTPLDLAAISTAKTNFEKSPLNGDGIITAETTPDARLGQLVADIIATQQAAADHSGNPGINQPKLDQFYTDIAARAEWLSTATPDKLPLGENTHAAHAALQKIRAKIDDYFARCRLAAYDTRALTALNRNETEYLPLLAADLRADADELHTFPLAQITPGKHDLDLATAINPAWAAPLADFTAATLAPIHGPGKTTLTPAEWNQLTEKFAPYETWLATQTNNTTATLPPDRIRQIADTADTDKTTLAQLIADDATLAPQYQNIADLDRLLRYQRDLRPLLENFVNFTDFYAPDRTAIFQAGTLYFDTRSCDLCVRVTDPETHSTLAAHSNACIAYCDLRRPDGQTMKIAAAFTQGDSDYLMPGRNGIFYDRQGRDWDATITKLVDNPISLRAAFWLPYKKFVRMIENLAAKRAAAADDKATTHLNTAALTATTADQQQAAAPAAAPKKIDVGTVAALGVAFGALTTAIAAISTGLMRLEWWQIALIPVAVILLISLPSVFIAWLKLRQRTLGPILDATGWAINGRIKINIPLGSSLTQRARLPKNSAHTSADPYKHRHPLLKTLLLLIIAASLAAAYYLHQKPNPQQPADTPAPPQPATENATATPAPNQ